MIRADGQHLVVACACPCHVDERPDSDLPDVTDVIAAATACDACRPYHTPALLNTTPANAPLPKRHHQPRPWVLDTDEDEDPRLGGA